MLMTTCCFLLPPMAGEKVTANGFAFLSSVLYLIYFASNLPFHETEVPILGEQSNKIIKQTPWTSWSIFFSHVL